MKIIQCAENAEYGRSIDYDHFYNIISASHVCATLGCFDGLHIGHVFLLNQLNDYCKQLKQKSTTRILITFDQLPDEYFGKQVYRIGLLRDNIRAINQTNLIDFIVILHFNRYLAMMDHNDFVLKIIIKQLKINAMFVGEDFVFGYNKLGSINTLITHNIEAISIKRANLFNYFCLQNIKNIDAAKDYSMLSLLKLQKNNNNKNQDKNQNINSQDNNSIDTNNNSIYSDKYTKINLASSSAIRLLSLEQNLSLVYELLGYRNICYSARIIRGMAIGRKFACPTINLDFSKKITPVLFGVYAGFVTIDNIVYKAAISSGWHPTINRDNTKRKIEAYLIDFDNHNQELYGKLAKVEFVRFIREERYFDDITLMFAQIKYDIQSINLVLDAKI